MQMQNVQHSLFRCLLQLSEHCESLCRTPLESVINDFRVVLLQMQACYQFMSWKKESLYVTTALAVVESCESQVNLPRQLVLISINLNTFHALGCLYPAQARKQVEQILGIPALNLLRTTLGKTELPCRESESDESALGEDHAISSWLILARYRYFQARLQQLQQGNMHDRGFSPSGFVLTTQSRALLMRAKSALQREVLEYLQNLSRWTQAPFSEAQVLEVARDCLALHRLAHLLNLNCSLHLLSALLHLLWRQLRWQREDKDKHSTLFSNAFTLLSFVTQQELGQGDTGADEILRTPAAQTLANQLQGLLAANPPSTVAHLQFDQLALARLRAIDANEQLVLLQRIQGFIDQCEAGPDTAYVSSELSTLLYKLTLNLLTLDKYVLYELADSLRTIVSTQMRQHKKVEQSLLDVLRSFSQECNAPALLQTSQLSLQLLQMETDCLCSRRRTESATGIVEAQTKLPLQLASCIRLLPTAETILRKLLLRLLPSRLQAEPEVQAICAELQLLVEGAHVLKVYRVEALASVLLEFQQQARDSARWQILVLRAHRSLRKMLNQAAAHQEVSSARRVIALLYQWLESTPATTCGIRQQSLFNAEAADLLQTIEEAADSLACHLETTGPIQQLEFPGDHRVRLLGALHTLKGNALLFDYRELANCCHLTETLIQQLAIHADSLAAPQAAAQVRAACIQLRESLTQQSSSQVSESIVTDGYSRTRLLMTSRDIALPASLLQRLTRLASSCQLGQQRIQRLLRLRSEQPAELRELLNDQAERLSLLEQQLQEARQTTLLDFRFRSELLIGKLGNELDKQVRLRMLGTDVRVDRIVLDYLQPTLEHLLRNAIIHGVEPLDIRRAHGKPETATVTLEVKMDAAHWYFHVSDDGGGIDTDLLMHHALAKGMDVALDTAPTDRLQWLFLPGFSTSGSLSLHAGRGLGLEIVMQAVTALGGQVDVSSVLNQGSCFRVILPRCQYNDRL